MEFTKEKLSSPVTPVALCHDDSDRLDDEQPYDERRVWIGNIDTTLAEIAILKLVQPFGELKTFDYIYHKTGPEKGQPRGFCFVTYQDKVSANKLVSSLNGYKLNSRKLVVRIANRIPPQPQNRKSSPSVSTTDQKSRIAAIEAKLLQMEREDKALRTTKSVPEKTQSNIPNRQITRTKPYDRSVGRNNRTKPSGTQVKTS